MSVGTPTEGKLGLVREKRGGREVGIIAIASQIYFGWEGGKRNQGSYNYFTLLQISVGILDYLKL